jgi:23S rRNA (pseudouridine1915-N3)-methyltransferase
MKISLLLTGKTDDANIQKAISEYEKRLKFYVPFETIVIPALKNIGALSHAQIKEKEGIAISQHMDKADFTVLLDERGREFTSTEFAEFVQSKMNAGTRHLMFVVGGAFGFSESIYKKAHAKIALSKMTFPHQMVRLVFAEQLYRAMTILKNEKYHHD